MDAQMLQEFLKQSEQSFDESGEVYRFVVEECKRRFGNWDSADPVSWGLIRVVSAHLDLQDAIDEDVNYGIHDGLEPAIAERIAAIDALWDAILENPRDDQ
jgi:hypothetical protein